uniref:Mitoguardin 1 n=1 Tax=Xiphophorus couchianus TaxID=32473 RepID=A0A3B5MZD4_9TELE
MTHETLTSSQLSLKAAALRMVDLPLSVYSSLTQVSVSTSTKKLVAATTFGTISLLFLARRFQRRKGRKKGQSPQWDQVEFEFVSPTAAENDNTSQNISVNFSSKNSCSAGSGLVLTTRDYRKLSGSLMSLASVKSVNSSSSSTCANESIGWDGGTDADVCSVVNLSITTPENLYLMGENFLMYQELLENIEFKLGKINVFYFILLSEHRDLRNTFPLGHHPFYEEALQMAEEGKISCRVLRTEILECLGDLDFLAKLHCVRQACELILSDRATRMFLADTGKKILSSIIVKAQKSPKRFEEVFEELIVFLEHSDHWEDTELELASRGVRHLSFYDVVLDFILMDSFEDLENPPISIQNVINNRWLNSSFKETAVASSCWSVLKQKRQHMKVSNGFIAHFYAVCEQISPVLAWGFLGPKSSLHEFCCFFKDQVLHFLKDVFDLDKVRYSSMEMLAEDMLHLLHRRSDLLLAYLGADALRPLSSCSGPQVQLVPSALLEAQVQ